MPSAEPERWLPVAEYEGFYEVSDLGRVRRLWRHHYKILKPVLTKDACHLRVHLCRDGVRRKVTVHTLVARAFLGPRPEGMQVCHGPGGSLDNRLVNLSFGSPSKNNGADRWRDDTIPAGERCSKAKLTNEIVLECRARVAAGESRVSMAKEFGVAPQAIARMIRGETWKNVPFAPGTAPVVIRRSRGNGLDESGAREIRARVAAGESQVSLSREFGVSHRTVSLLVLGRTWKHVPFPDASEPPAA